MLPIFFMASVAAVMLTVVADSGATAAVVRTTQTIVFACAMTLLATVAAIALIV